jgi:Na+-driven multidrug efflux pump
MTHAAPAPAATAAAAARAARTARLLTGPIGPTLARLAAPNVLAMVVVSAMSIAEGAFAGLLGLNALAGLALVFPFVMLVQMLSAGAMGGAISAAVARALGAGDAPRAARLALHAFLIAICAAGLSAALMTLFGPSIFALLGGEGEALSGAVAYASVFFPGCAALWLCHAALSVIRGTGNMATPSLLLLLVSAASIPLSGALGLGWGPFPRLGMAGLAGGLIGAFAIGGAVAIGWVVMGRAGLTLRGAAGLSGALAWDILRVGLVASLSACQTVITVVAMVGLVGRFGPEALAGYGLAARLEFLMVPVVFGIGAAMTAMVGANMGAGARDRAVRVAWTGSCAAGVLVGGVGLFFAAFPEVWLGMFLSPDADGARAAGQAYFRIAAPFYGFFAVGLGLYFASQGAGRVIWPVLTGFARMAVAVGGGIALVRGADFGIEGVFAAVAAGMVAYGVLTAIWLWRTGWR